MKKYRFRAKIQAGDGGGAYVLFPFDIEKEFGGTGKVAVQAVLNGVHYAGTLIKYGHPRHILPVLKAIRRQAGADVGDTLDVELWKDETPRTLDTPAAFQQAMQQAGVLGIFDKLSYTHRREYCRWITGAKKEETRLRRIEQAVGLLKKGMQTPDGAGRAKT